MRYLITFTCYGAHLHGSDKGSADRNHNLVGSRSLRPDSVWQSRELELMVDAPYSMDYDRRMIVLQTLHEVCTHRGWTLLAAHVRSTHVHVVVESETRPELILNTFKAYSSRNLNQSGEPECKRWTRHGSTRWLWNDQQVRQAIRYVIEGQGLPMNAYNAEAL